MVIRTVLMYAAILAAVRVMGKRQISQLQTSELVATLLISELAILPIQEGSLSLWTGILPMAVLVLCELLVSFGMLKSSSFRRLVCGSPTVVIRQGELLQSEMRRLRITTEDVMEQLRQNGVFYLEDVAWAIMETNGIMNVIRRPDKEPVTPRQLQLKPEPPVLETSVISDGEVSLRSLKLIGKDQDWLNRRLKEQGVSAKEIFLMTARSDGKWRIIKKQGK